jgi:hypothetical protein
MKAVEGFKTWLNSQKVKKARKSAGWQKDVKPTGRVIDMTARNCGWGWDFYGFKYDRETESITISGWCSPRPKVGDVIEMDLRLGGRTRFTFAHVKYVRDPEDMWKAHIVDPVRVSDDR